MEMYDEKSVVKDSYIKSSIDRLNYLKTLNLDDEKDLVIAEGIMKTLTRNVTVLDEEVGRKQKQQRIKKKQREARKKKNQ